MAPVQLLDPQRGEKICDLCAAPGGKTTQIAGRMAGEGLLLCNEINPKRAKILSRNIERMAVSNAMVTNEHPGVLAERFRGFFDRVLVDAPCSGEGMFRKEEAAVTDWSPEAVSMCARRQGEILHSGAHRQKQKRCHQQNKGQQRELSMRGFQNRISRFFKGRHIFPILQIFYPSLYEISRRRSTVFSPQPLAKAPRLG